MPIGWGLNVHKTKIPRRNLLFLAFFLFILVFILPPADPYSATPGIDLASETKLPPAAFPAQYGEIIFQSNEKNPNQVYVIGMSHRDTFTKTNGNYTSLSQAEVYMIADWLYHNKGVRLLLPEGFFKSKSAEVKEINKKIQAGLKAKNSCADLADFQLLRERLADNHTFTNAEMLLKESHSIHLRQVEDWPIYDAVSKVLLKVVRDGPACDISLLKELDYLQERRVAGMLQRMPDVINDSFQRKDISEKKAIFTIGMMHVFHIIKYLNENKIAIQPPESGSTKREDYGRK